MHHDESPCSPAVDSHIHSAATVTECPANENPGSGDLSTSTLEGLALCTVVGFENEVPILKFELNGVTHLCKAVAVTGVSGKLAVGMWVCVGFDQQRCDRPIVLGKLLCDTAKHLASGSGIVISDERRIMFKCGKASITLNSDGTVSIRGTNVASRASHTNRIRGGNVQIN